MISSITSANISAGYANTVGKSDETSQRHEVKISRQGDTSKVQQIKDALESGEYKVNLQALSKKIAQELM